MDEISIKFSLSLFEEVQRYYKNKNITWNDSYNFHKKIMSFEKFKDKMENIYGLIKWKKIYYLNIKNNKYTLFENQIYNKKVDFDIISLSFLYFYLYNLKF